MHDYEANCLHLVYPGLVLSPRFGNGRPVVWILHWTVKVDYVVVKCQSRGNILPWHLISYQKVCQVNDSEG